MLSLQKRASPPDKVAEKAEAPDRLAWPAAVLMIVAISGVMWLGVWLAWRVISH